MRWIVRIGFLLVLLLLFSVFSTTVPYLYWIDWLVPVLFFGIRDAPWFVAASCGALSGLVMTLFSVHPNVAPVLQAVLLCLVVVWLYPLIQWNHPKNALVAWWGVLVMDGLASMFLPLLLGHEGPEGAGVADLVRLTVTGVLGSVIVGVLYGTGEFGALRPGSRADEPGR